MQTSVGNLVIVGANTPDCKVFWKGTEIPCVGVVVYNDDDSTKVVLKVAEDPAYAEMAAAGITIRRAAQ